MIRLAFAGARLFATGVLLLTWGYGAAAYSPFVFDMFVAPRLLPWLTDFVIWHYLWYWLAYLLSAATLVGDLGLLTHAPPPKPATRWAAIGYLAVFGAAGWSLTLTPHLAGLTSGSRNLLVVPGALLPLVWLAVIDHLACPIPRTAARVTGQPRLLEACLLAGAFVFFVHLVRAGVPSSAALAPWSVAAAWALALDLMVLLIVYAIVSFNAALASTRGHAVAWEYGLALVFSAVVIAEFFRQIVFAPVSINGPDAAIVAAPLGVALSLMWAGLRRRSAGTRLDHTETAIDLLWALPGRRGAARWAWLVVVPVAASIGINAVERVDWGSILHRVIACTEAMLVFGVFVNFSRRRQDQRWSYGRLLSAPLLALVAVHLIPYAATRLVAATGDGRLDPQGMIDRYELSDILASVAATQLVERRTSDAGYNRQLLDGEASQPMLKPAAPAQVLLPHFEPTSAPQPNVFFFVIDSMRRDYLSPYNAAVTFTPGIDQFARENYVFRNTFTRYGATWMSVPSIWTGSVVTRGWSSVFQRMNALEPLIVGRGYDFLINDYAIEKLLRKDTRRTFLNPYVASPQTDLCQGLQAIESHLDHRAPSAPPVFAYLSPMNIHILNTMTGSTDPDPRYPGFHAPYASRLERIDGCFGNFVADLKQRGLYDRSIIILTSDHGDSLGNEGQWGHQRSLFPETVRVPLIVHLPAGPPLTADLGRVTFLTDIAPTLMSLLGEPVPDLGPLFGSPLFVAPDTEPTPRRRDSFMVMASYASIYGVVRRNGRFLYISDLLNFREHAYTLFKEPLGEPVMISDALRRVNQVLVLDRAAQVNAHFRLK